MLTCKRLRRLMLHEKRAKFIIWNASTDRDPRGVKTLESAVLLGCFSLIQPRTDLSNLLRTRLASAVSPHLRGNASSSHSEKDEHSKPESVGKGNECVVAPSAALRTMAKVPWHPSSTQNPQCCTGRTRTMRAPGTKASSPR